MTHHLKTTTTVTLTTDVGVLWSLFKECLIPVYAPHSAGIISITIITAVSTCCGI